MVEDGHNLPLSYLFHIGHNANNKHLSMARDTGTCNIQNQTQQDCRSLDRSTCYLLMQAAGLAFGAAESPTSPE